MIDKCINTQKQFEWYKNLELGVEFLILLKNKENKIIPAIIEPLQIFAPAWIAGTIHTRKIKYRLKICNTNDKLFEKFWRDLNTNSYFLNPKWEVLI